MKTPRELFADALEARRATGVAEMTAMDAMQKEYEVAAIAEAKKVKPKARVKDIHKAKDLLGEAWSPFYRVWEDKASAILQEYDTAKEGQKKAIDALASECPVLKGDQWLMLDQVWFSDYSSQGFGAEAYARASAESKADIPRYYGVETEVRPTKSEHGKIDRYQVWVQVEGQTDVDLLRRKPGPSLREIVKACWKRGVNPRVYHSWLPWDYETKNGLDFFGNDVIPEGK